MCHADITLKNIYDLYKHINKEILIDVNDDLSDDSDSDIEEYLQGIDGFKASKEGKSEKVSQRQQQIN